MGTLQWRLPCMLIALSGGNAAADEVPYAVERHAAMDTEARGHVAATAAHHLCAGIFVVGRDHQRSAEEVLAMDIARFPEFFWSDAYHYSVDMDEQIITVRGPGIEPARKARYHGDQGCTILPTGTDQIFFDPEDVVTALPDPATQAWPLGDVDAHAAFDEVDQGELDTALDGAMARTDMNTRALVIAYRGKSLVSAIQRDLAEIRRKSAGRKVRV